MGDWYTIDLAPIGTYEIKFLRVIDYMVSGSFNDEPLRNTLIDLFKSFYDVANVTYKTNKVCLEVICDRTNNTPQVVDDNQLIVDAIFRNTADDTKTMLRYRFSPNGGIDWKTFSKVEIWKEDV